MEKMTAVLREERLSMVIDVLRDRGYDGITITQVRGPGRQRGQVGQWRGTEFRQDLLPKVKIEMVVDEAQTDAIIDPSASVRPRVPSATARSGSLR